MPSLPVLARAGVHLWEEPCISGKNGSGTVFFSGCNLKCIYCQNEKISLEGFGKPVTAGRLSEIFAALEQKGVHNLNLVTPSHYAEAVAEALTLYTPHIPVIWNSGGYDSLRELRLLEGQIDVFLPDFKYSDNALAAEYSGAPDYFETASAAIREMYRQTGDCVYSEDGMLQKGVLIRHLVLPGQLDNSKGVIDFLSAFIRDKSVLFSLMSQFTPTDNCPKELSRRLTKEEYDTVCDYLFDSGITDGFMQELSSAEKEYIPDFDLSGI